MASQSSSNVVVGAVVNEAGINRAVAIREYNELRGEFEAAKAKGNKKVALSVSAKMSIRSARIATAELDLALEGVEFETWVKPTTSTKTSRMLPMSQDEIETKIAALVKIRDNEKTPETVKVTADQRIQALKKSATKRGYTLS